MTVLKGVVGAALFVYTVLYILQVVFSSLYAELLSPSEVWQVMNYVTAVGIIIAAGVAYAHKRRLRPETPAGQTIGALAAFYTTLALGIWFFTVWFRLLTLGEGEAVSEADNVIWSLISVMNPFVLGTTGLRCGSRRCATGRLRGVPDGLPSERGSLRPGPQESNFETVLLRATRPRFVP